MHWRAPSRSMDEEKGTIHAAINNGHFQQIRFLIDQGADVNAKDKSGRTALVLCTLVSNIRWSVGLARLLIENGARISGSDSRGFNALHHACVNQRGELVDVYLSALDCDIHSRCKEGNTSLHYAAALGDVDIVTSLAKLISKYKLSFDPKNKKGLTPLHKAFKANQVSCGDFLVHLGADATVCVDLEMTSANQLRQEAVERLQLMDRLKSQRKSARIVRKLKGNAEEEKPHASSESINVARECDLRNTPEYVFNTTAIQYFQGKDRSRIRRCQSGIASQRKDATTAAEWKDAIVGLWDHYEIRFSDSYRTPAKCVKQPNGKQRSDSVLSGNNPSLAGSRRSSRVLAPKARAGSITIESGGGRRSSVASKRGNGTLPLVRTQSRSACGLSGIV